MEKMIETTKVSEILWEEFMKPLDISAYKLAMEIHVPVSRVQDILHDRRFWGVGFLFFEYSK